MTVTPPTLRVRIEDASLLDLDGPVRVVVSGLADPALVAAAAASSGARIEVVGTRLRAVTTPSRLVDGAGRAGGAELAGQVESALTEALDAWRAGAPDLQLRDGVLATATRAQVMAVLNVTPDSFSDGGVHYDRSSHPARAIAAAEDMIAAGADLIDVGGESTRPGAVAVDLVEELRRAIPVVEALAAAGHTVSIDTTKAEVARQAVAAGAAIVNDISAGAIDPGLLEAVASSGAAYIAMHMQGTPTTMQTAPDYDDVVAEVYESLADTVDQVVAAGLARECVVVDPGIGFGKSVAHNLELLRRARELTSLGRPLLVGTSRKSFLATAGGTITGNEVAAQRVTASVVSAALAVAAGARIVRVHDVAETVEAVRTAAAIAQAGREG